MNKIDWKDVATRAFKTFVQAAVAGLVALGTTDINLDNAEVIALSAGAAALSVIWNALVGAFKS